MELQKARQILKKYFGYDHFRPMQEEIISTVFQKRDSLVLMPTGGGKSICFQLPAMVMPGACVVVSPLIALMKDQVEGLRENGVSAAFLNSSLNSGEQLEVENRFFNGELDLLYISPEKLLSQGFLPLLKKAKVNLFAIDEAHCISAWGHDFRPEYTQLRFIKNTFPDIPIIALTATADKLTRKDIIEQLGLKNPEVFIASFDRPNIALNVVPGQRRFEQILAFLKKHPNQSGIIYSLSRRSTEELAEKLRAQGFKAGAYHAGLSAAERTRIQEAFTNDTIPIICATIAFGMGIDKSNIRWVIHYNLPKNVESYYQEIGRAGRDGAKAEAMLFYSFNDVNLLRDIILENPGDQAEVQLAKLDRMRQYAESQACRRRILLGYFGETQDRNCGNCDVCKNPPEYFDGTVIAQKAFSAIYRLQQEAPLNLLIDILRGSGKKEILDKGFDKIKTYGAGRDMPTWEWQQYLLQLINLGYIEVAYDQHNALKLATSSHSVLFDNQKIQLVKATSFREKQEAQPKLKLPTQPERQRDELFEVLRQVRKRLAQQYGLPPYIIFSDATLEEMAAKKPLNAMAMLMITGVGETKMERYGDYFLDAIADFLNDHKAGNKGATYQISLEMFRKGMSPEAIAEKRQLSPTTIISHLAVLYEQGENVPVEQFISAEEIKTILGAMKYIPPPVMLKSLHEYFDGKFSYTQIRFALAHQERLKKPS